MLDGWRKSIQVMAGWLPDGNAQNLQQEPTDGSFTESWAEPDSGISISPRGRSDRCTGGAEHLHLLRAVDALVCSGAGKFPWSATFAMGKGFGASLNKDGI